MYDLSDPTAWYCPGVVTLYRSIPFRANFQPDEPFPSIDGRFDGNSRLTLYLSESGTGAVAEWLRHYPEFISMQDDLRIKLSEITIQCDSNILDIRTEEQAGKIGFPFDRLTSSEKDPHMRYKECRDLADNASESTGIAYPNASLMTSQSSNVVLFGEKGVKWNSSGYNEVDRPFVDVGSVRIIESA
ncbi:MAG: RES family NAD+ phosphorylase [Acidimicrobiales bacterium]|nr:RES family NAD+ phosphorylase [Acidimicrobiales bacterium]